MSEEAACANLRIEGCLTVESRLARMRAITVAMQATAECGADDLPVDAGDVEEYERILTALRNSLDYEC